MNSPASNGAVPRVLVADDSETIQKVVKIALARHPVKIETAASWQDAASKIGSGIALLMLDVNLPGVGSDPQRLKEVVAAAAGLPVVVMQGTHERSLGEAALRDCGVSHILQKPFDSAELVSTVTRLTAISQSAPSTQPIPPPPPPASAPGMPVAGMSAPDAGEFSLNLEGLPPLPADLVDTSRKGKKAFEAPASMAPSPVAAPVAPEDLFRMVPPPPPPASPGATAPMQSATPMPSMQPTTPVSPVPPMSMPTAQPSNDELARQVRQAVEAYCEKHFRSLAIEVITAELRRLAEEKARHLVDI